MSTHRARDRGFTLIELVMATVLSGIVAGVLVAAIATSLRVASSTTNEIADSTDTVLISTFLFRDAQAAGVPDPAVAGVTDPPVTLGDYAVGVSTKNDSTGWAGCQQPGDLVVRFSWFDREADAFDAQVVVTYALDNRLLTRRVCQEGEVVDVVLGNNIAAAAAVCAPDACDGVTDGVVESVSLTFSGSASANPSEYTLTASMRPEAQPLPTIDGSSLVPLVVLGGPSETTPCPVVTVNGDTASPIMVVGDAVIAAECGTDPIGGTGDLVNSLGVTRTLSGLTDPFASLAPPAFTCDASAVVPTLVGDGPSLAPGDHPDHVVISDAVELVPGTYVFCEGLEIQSGATVTGTDVFLFVAGGTLSVDPAATVNLTAPATGPYQNMLVWVATSQQVTVGGDAVSRFVGHIYAPTSDLVVAGAAPTMLGGAVARSIDFGGDGAVRVGLPVPTVTITPSTVPDGQVGLAYPATTLGADGGQSPYTWSANGLPPGVELDPSSGVISGAPTEPGTYDVVVTVLGATNAAASAHISVEISAALSIAGPTQLPDGQVGVAYPEEPLLERAGGTAPFTWTSTEMPAGLVLDPANGVLSGTPTIAGSFPVTVTITDAMSATASIEYTVVVRALLVVATPALPGGQVDVAYPSTALNAAGGTPPTTWTANGLPPGLGISPAGTLTGTPTTPGTFDIVVQVTDAISATATTTFTVTIAPPLGVATLSLPRGQVGVAYPATPVLATGGTPPFVWSATGLPAGLTINSTTGVVAGTPTVAGSSTVVAQVIDATGTTSAAEYSVVIDAALALAGPATLPTGQVGLAYPSTLVSSSGGTSPYTWSATGLPPGLTISATTGVVSGIPTAAGQFPAVVTVTDALSIAASRRYDMDIVAALSITTETLPDGKLDVAYPATTVVAEGGQAPGTWSASGLPTGLTIETTTGVITGTPSATGASTVVIAITDAAGATATRSFSVTVSSDVPAGCPVAPTGWRGEYFANMSLTGDPTICRDDPSINFDWGSSGSPGPGIAAEDFSARWTRTQEFDAGIYTFEIGSDDGSRLYIDGELVFDRWVDQAYPDAVPTVTRTLAAGEHLIVMEYYERNGNARATLAWTVVNQPMPCTGVFSGWKGEYFSNAQLIGPPAMCRSDASINFNWGSGSPSTAIQGDRFSARWTRTVNFTAGTYRFALGSDDGSRLYIDGVLVLDRWAPQRYPNPVPTVDRSLQAGNHTIVVEYFENYGGARATMEWTKQSNGVTATATVAGDHRWYGENRIALTNTSTITAMTVTIVVDRTDDLKYAGMWTNFAGGAVKSERETEDDSIVYTFDLKSNKTIDPGAWTLVAQTSGTGTLHPTAGDTWSVVTTSLGVTNTITGTF